MNDSKEIPNILVDFYKKYDKYIVGEPYVFKLCSDVSNNSVYKEWLVIMQKLDDTLTNEKRSDVLFMDHAKFRANKLKVIEIVNVHDTNITQNCIVNAFDRKKTVYTVGDIVKPDEYDANINKVCSNGIHYYRSLLAAYSYRDPPSMHTGVWMQFSDNGTYTKTYYVAGKEIPSNDKE